MFADVTSANVVGYQNQLMTSSKMNWFCNTFVPCDKTRETITLGDIKPTAGLVDSYIVFLDENGAVNKIDVPGLGTGIKENYYYYDEDTAEDGAGWYLADKDEDLEHNMNSRVVKLGESFYLKCSAEVGEGLTYAGVVDAGSVPLAMASSKMNWVGNCSPTMINLGDITPSEGFVDSYIVFLDENGAVNKIDVPGLGTGIKENYYYYGEDMAEDGAGWYLADKDEDLEHNMNTKRKLNAGEAFYLKCSAEVGEGIVIPSALPKK